LADPLAATLDLLPQVRAARDELESIRHMPSALARTIGDAGLFQLYLPRAIGGAETPPLTTFRVIEELSKVDGSVGWCVMIANSVSLFTGWLAPDVGRDLFGQPPVVRMAGSVRPEGRARAVDGGYRVSGQWNFASGVHHANWLFCTCTVMDGDTPRWSANRTPVIRSMYIPAEHATIKDTWNVVGMCGTGSHDFVIDDVFVPEAHAFSLYEAPKVDAPLCHPRLVLAAAWTNTAANALGIARGAMDTFVELASHTGSTNSVTPLRDRPLVQSRIAEAEAILGAARAYVLESVGAAWAAVCEQAADPGPEIARARLAITHAMHEAVRAVDVVFHTAGTNAVYRKHPLERYFRDIHVAVQHAAGLPAHVESAGKALLGLRPTDLGW
jgi:alkylation response protein AidB-like acyl-CoA dehydrogenase